MRLLEQKKIEYKEYTYLGMDAINGFEVANALNQNPNQVFKTLVTIGKSKEYYVFVVPVNCELNLKKAAKTVSEKSIAMIKAKELLGLTGYIHGGCSPIGMKKKFKIIIHKSAKELNTIIFSGGKIGYQVEVNIEDLKKIISFVYGDVIDERN